MASYAEQVAKDVVEKLKVLTLDTDVEHIHGEADKILVQFLRTIGFKSVAAAYEKVKKWYA